VPPNRDWVEDESLLDSSRMEGRWTQSIAVGSESFIDQVHKALGIKGKHKDIIEDGNSCFINESNIPYNVHFATKIDIITYFPRKKDRTFLTFSSPERAVSAVAMCQLFAIMYGVSNR